MSDLAARNAVFLDEMGIGPLWSLRDALGGAPFDDAVPSAQDDVRSAAPDAAPVAEVAQVAPLAPARADDGSSAVPRAAASVPASPVVTVAAPVVARPPAPVAAPEYAADAFASAPAAAGVTAAANSSASESAWADDDAGQPSAPATDAQIALMDWRQLRAAVAGCTRCSLCRSGRKPLFGSGAQSAQWVVVAGATTLADEKEHQPVAGESGKLLHNMLAAVGLARDSNAYVTNLIKCRPTNASGGDRAPTGDEAQACRPYVEREIVLSGAKLVLTLGQIAANGLLDQPLTQPLSATRGKAYARAGAPLVPTLHPGELLRRGTDKALAWSDLLLAKEASDA